MSKLYSIPEAKYLTQEMIDGFISYSHELIQTKRSNYPTIEPHEYADIYHVVYNKKGLLGKTKTTSKTFTFKRLMESKGHRYSWVATDAAQKFGDELAYLSNKEDDNTLEKQLRNLEDEYINNSDDFSSGVIFAIEKVKELMGDNND